MVLGKSDMFIYSWKKWQLEKVTVGKNDFGKNVALPMTGHQILPQKIPNPQIWCIWVTFAWCILQAEVAKATWIIFGPNFFERPETPQIPKFGAFG